MKIKDYLILGTASLLIGYVFASIEVSTVKNLDPDTLVAEVPIDTTIDVKGKVALFIGDSHTSNHSAGWQKQLCDSVGFKMKNESVGGKTTYWMINQALYTINDNIDYCFVYGGANDMYGIISPQAAIENIKGIARMCNGHNVKCIVLTGFDPVKCTATKNPNYAKKYAMFQHLLMTEYMDGATVVDTRVVDKRDCWDELCHMAPSGHRKIASKVIKDLKLKKVSK
jgi:lysophospholipase L1-like esterase